MCYENKYVSKLVRATVLKSGKTSDKLLQQLQSLTLTEIHSHVGYIKISRFKRI